MRVRWRGVKPPDGLNASRSIPFEEGKPAVQLSVVYATEPNKGDRMAFEDAWGYVIHELIALGLTVEHFQAHEDAAFGNLTKEAYIEKHTWLEHIALTETKKFYETVWKPWAEQKKIPSRPFRALAGYTPSYEEWIKQSDCDGRHYYSERWASHYDSTVASYSRNVEMPELTTWQRVSAHGLTGGGVLLFILFVCSEIYAWRSARSRARVAPGAV